MMSFSLSERNKTKIAKKSRNFIGKFLIFVLLLGLSYVILYPFLFKILGAFMSENDMNNALVDLIPIDWTFLNFEYVLALDGFYKAFFNTFLYALICAALSTISAAMVGYGIAKFKFKGVNLLTVIIIIIMLMPIQTLSIPLYLKFRYFDIFGILGIFGCEGVNLLDSIWPIVIMSATSLGFRSGIFIVLMRQYYIGIPNELIEAAYVDGSGSYRTFVQIILPMAKSMLIVIFSFSFAWQWTDTFYSDFLFGNVKLLPSSIISILNASSYNNNDLQYQLARANAGAILAILPLIVLYIILQRKIIQGIERSGLVG